MGIGSSCSTLWLAVSSRAAGASWLSPGQTLKFAYSDLPWGVGGPGTSLRVAKSGHGVRDNMAGLRVGQPSKTLLPKEQPLSPLRYLPHLQALPPAPFAEGVSEAADVSGKEATTRLHLWLPTLYSTGCPTPSPTAWSPTLHQQSTMRPIFLLPWPPSPPPVWRQNTGSKNSSLPRSRILLEIPMVHGYRPMIEQTT